MIRYLLLIVLAWIGTSTLWAQEPAGLTLPTWTQLAPEIGVDDLVRRKVDDLLFEHEKQSIDIRSELKKQKLELYRGINSLPLDEAKVMAMVDSVNRTEA